MYVCQIRSHSPLNRKVLNSCTKNLQWFLTIFWGGKELFIRKDSQENFKRQIRKDLEAMF